MNKFNEFEGNRIQDYRIYHTACRYDYRCYNKKTKVMSKRFSLFNTCIEPEGIEDRIYLQYIGKQDKNKVDICEGDILAFEKSNKKWKTGEAERMVVSCHPELVRFVLNFCTIFGGEGYTGKWEHISEYIQKGAFVIGNIYENWDLVKTDSSIKEKSMKNQVKRGNSAKPQKVTFVFKTKGEKDFEIKVTQGQYLELEELRKKEKLSWNKFMIKMIETRMLADKKKKKNK